MQEIRLSSDRFQEKEEAFSQTHLARITNVMDSKISVGQPERHWKAWGWEDWIVNNDKYCAKILHFHKGAKFSLHFHLEKHETWYVASGFFQLIFIDTTNGKQCEMNLPEGHIITIPQGLPHQLIAMEDGNIFEASTPHKESDSYRIAPGDSQK
jgi:mannose-6-phosphate isomerase-like protein (cupin superfamily)